MPNMQLPILANCTMCLSIVGIVYNAKYAFPILPSSASYSTCFDIFGIVDNAIYVMVMFLVIGRSKGWSDGMLTGCHPERTECI